MRREPRAIKTTTPRRPPLARAPPPPPRSSPAPFLAPNRTAATPSTLQKGALHPTRVCVVFLGRLLACFFFLPYCTTLYFTRGGFRE